ncbi:hypothetical protein [uncultured Sphaerochaeta sp.]|nr:hypothetical protein [uncultured Sphaerochaeta sp.]
MVQGSRKTDSLDRSGMKSRTLKRTRSDLLFSFILDAPALLMTL